MAGRYKSGRQPRTTALTPRKQRFVEEYLVDLNGAAAARRTGYSQVQAASRASQLLADPSIQGAISAAMLARSRKVGLKAEDVLDAIQCVLLGDPTELLEMSGGTISIRDLKTLPKNVTKAIKSVKQVQTEAGPVVTVMMHDKVQAAKLAMDHLGMNAPVKHDHSVEVQSKRERLAALLEELRGSGANRDPAGAKSG